MKLFEPVWSISNLRARLKPRVQILAGLSAENERDCGRISLRRPPLTAEKPAEASSPELSRVVRRYAEARLPEIDPASLNRLNRRPARLPMAQKSVGVR